ncbi:MAG: hypothetical protein J6T51_02745 [Kiritimatiellae bacterium]|nr:hypothetical protein [Kiritimatiellia bacterium]
MKTILAALCTAAGAAFTAFADGLPEGYTQVPFIKANGNCQIQTGIVPNSTDKVELSWRPTVVSGNQGLWCSRDSSAKNTFTAFMISNKVRLDRVNTSVTCAGLLLAGTNYTVVADYATLAGVVTNDISHTELTSGTMPSGTYTPTSELCLFASHQGEAAASYGNAGSWACYSFKLSDSAGNLRLNLVPAKRDADGELGLYDLVRSTFLTNCNSGVFTTANMTITPSDPLWGAALTIADDITIDAGEGATWQGAITVRDGGSLKTRGNLNVSGSTTVDVGASVDVETGTQIINFAQNIKGSLTVRADATLKFNAAERFHDSSATAVFHLYGTMDVQSYQQRIDKGTYFFHNGSRVVNNGSATVGGLYVYNDSRVVFDGTVEIEPPIALVDAKTFTVACCENAHVSFRGGVIVSATGRRAGNIVQVAATVAEGNAAGTCANAFLDFGPVAVGDIYDFTGSFTFLSNAKIALGLADSAFSVTTSGSELEIESDKAVAFANHAAAQTLPAITTSTATVRLTGDGTLVFPATAPAYPIEFAGPSLIIANNAPVALAAGSSVTAPTTVGVEDLAAGTAATIFTNAGSIDASKISARAAHNGVLMGTAAAATLSGTDVVTAGVAAYDATAWIEPFIEATALIWLDASDAANFEFKDNTFGFVTTWKDKSSYKRDATAYTVPKFSETFYGTLTVTNGVPAYCMGNAGCGVDLQYAEMTTIRTAFFAMSIQQTTAAFWFGHTGSYNFHRGSTYKTVSTSGAYSYNSGGNQNNSWYCDGNAVSDICHTLVPTDRHVYSVVTAANGASNRLTADRPSSVAGRNAGRELSELIAFPTALSDSDRNAIEAYLAAKWMGANPTAARSDDTFIYKSDYTVDGNVGGGKNLNFEEGASVTVVNPSASEPMIATTGAVTLPSGSPLAVNVDATALVPGTYTVMQAGSGITDISQFAPTATTASGATATFSVVDGKLVMTIAGSSAATAQTWRPTSSADLGWNATSANWLYDGGTTGGFLAYVPAFIDGAETATGDITVSGTIGTGPVSVTGANDYTFKGDGTLAGNDTVTFGGTGTVTLDGANFGGQDIVITNGQKVVLGFNAGSNSLGTDSGSSGGKVTIAEGSQFNANDISLVATDPRSEITQLKTFSIAGDGPDGRGAIVNDVLDGRTSHSSQNCALRRIELSGDASIGGADRIDLRARSGTAATATPGIYGPGKTLTVKNSVWFASWSQPIDVGAIVIPAGGMFLPVQMTEAMFNVPGGITLDGGLIDHYQNAYPTNVPFYVTANGGTFQSGGGASTVKGDVTVASGATLALIGDKNVTYSGAFNANGAAITHSNSATTYFTGTSSGNLDITQTAGTLYLQNKVEGTMSVTKSGGTAYVGSGFSNSTVRVTQTGGTTGFNTQTAAPIFDSATFNVTGGTWQFVANGTAGVLDIPGVININQSSGLTYVFGPEGNKGVAAQMKGSIVKLVVGTTSSRPGFLNLKSGTDLTLTGDFSTGGNDSKPSRGEIVIESGAKVKVTGSSGRVINAYYAGEPDALELHKMHIYGELDASGSGSSWVTMDAPRGEMYLHDGGVLKVKNLFAGRSTTWQYGNGVAKNEGRAWFFLDGGRLEVGSGGIVGPRVPGITRFNLKNGEVNASAAWGCAPGMPLVFGDDELGGSVTLDIAGYNVDWNTGLSGASDLTIKGSANFQVKHVEDLLQGAMVGRLTVENTVSNDLSTASVFCGGLKLADGVNAQVAKYSDELYPYAIGTYREGSNTRDDTARIGVTAWSYPYVAANFWNFIHKKYNPNPHASYTTTAGRGQFYVPAEKAGTWTFAGTYDDRLRLYIGTNLVFATSASSGISYGSIALDEGWHTFTIVAYDATGNCGPTPSGWTGVMSLGFRTDESTSTAGGDYTKFEPGASLGDGLTLQVRPAVNACVWSHCPTKPATATYQTLDAWSQIKCLDSVEYMHMTGANAAADTLGFFSAKLNRFEGWFKVEDEKAGEWEFTMTYDDFHKFEIDGVSVIARKSSSAETLTEKKTLSAGWHRWLVIVGDSSSGWGPNARNNGMTLSYKAPGESAHSRFDETNLKLAATLGDIAVLEPSGIYKDLELGAGSTLTSSGTMAMPIFGTLKGTGTLAGAWEFAGTTNCWEVTGAGANSDTLSAATFSAATPATFAGLKSVKVTFDAKPSRRTYYLTGAIDGLTDVSAVTMIVKDNDGKDYSANFALGVRNGRLALTNSKPGGFVLVVE